MVIVPTPYDVFRAGAHDHGLVHRRLQREEDEPETAAPTGAGRPGRRLDPRCRHVEGAARCPRGALVLWHRRSGGDRGGVESPAPIRGAGHARHHVRHPAEAEYALSATSTARTIRAESRVRRPRAGRRSRATRPRRASPLRIG